MINIKPNNRFLNKVFLFWLILFSLPPAIEAQDVHFSQYYANQMYLNPALTGSSICPKFFVNYRNQWANMPDAYTTYSTSYDQYSKVLNGGIGFMAMNEVQASGLINSLSVSGLYSHSVKIGNRYYLKFGFQAGLMSRNLNWDKLVLGDMLDPVSGMKVFPTAEPVPDNLQRYFADFSTGVAIYSNFIYAGIAAHHINTGGGLTEKKTTAFFPQRYTFHAGGYIPMFKRGRKKEKLNLSPNIVIQHQQNSTQVNYGILLARKLHYDIVVGAWLRQDLDLNINSFIYLLGFVYKNYKFAYSYDVNKSTLTKGVLNSHEVSLTVRFRCNKNINEKHFTIKCPQF